MNKINVIFLDVDGVLNSEEYAIKYYNQFKKRGNKVMDDWNNADPQCINMILKICKTTNTKLIISSSWRYWTLSETIESFKGYECFKDLVPYIIGITPRSEERHRGKEVEYLLENWDKCIDNQLISKEYSRSDILDYLIIDDDMDFLEHQIKDHFLHTDYRKGLTEDNMNTILKRFS